MQQLVGRLPSLPVSSLLSTIDRDVMNSSFCCSSLEGAGPKRPSILSHQMIWWNRRWWFWVYRHVPPGVGGGVVLHRSPAQYWDDQWWDEGWYVFTGAPRSWQKPNYWGGVGCSCDGGHCCRRCPNRVRSRSRCRGCGNNEACRASRCGHPCCAQASPERVVQGLKRLHFHGRLTEKLTDDVINNIAGWLVDEPFAYG